jgi:hypothetical protein
MKPLPRSFRSSAQRGFSPLIQAEPGLMFAHKIPGEVW